MTSLLTLPRLSSWCRKWVGGYFSLPIRRVSLINIIYLTFHNYYSGMVSIDQNSLQVGYFTNRHFLFIILCTMNKYWNINQCCRIRKALLAAASVFFLTMPRGWIRRGGRVKMLISTIPISVAKRV